MYRKDISGSCQKWLESDEVNTLKQQMEPTELRLIRLMTDSSDMPNYFDGLTDTLDVLSVSTSASFSRFLNELSDRL